MLDAIRESSKGWLAKVILLLITIPFMLWGVESYFDTGRGGEVLASVNGVEISSQEFDEALRAQQEALRTSMGEAYDPALFNDPKVRQSILDGIIDQHLVLQAANKAGLTVSKTQMIKIIAGLPAFHENGQFSQARYDQVLRQQGLSIPEFENRLHQELLINDVRSVFQASAIMPSSVVASFLKAYEQQREISTRVHTPEQYMPQIQVNAGEIQAWYSAHKAEYGLPEQARYEYVVLSQDALAQQIAVSDAEVKKYYEQNSAKFSEPEQRRARHILIPVTPEEDAQKRAAAKARADALYQQVKADPGSFAAVAERESGDRGSAPQGGDLGWFPHNAMVKPFADAVFAMRSGDISPPVRSDFGYHIIELEGIKPAKTPALDAIQADIVDELRRQKAAQHFAEEAENFSNLVYEQSDSLKPAANALKLPIQTSAWITPKQPGDNHPLSSPKILQAMFSSDVLKDKRNTEAIEVAPNTLVAARLLEYKPATQQPLAMVRTDIEQQLKRTKAIALAEKNGKKDLAVLRTGKEPGGKWSDFRLLTRQQGDTLPANLVEPVFSADQRNLPAYAGAADINGNYTIVRVTRLIDPAPADTAKIKAMQSQLAQLAAQTDFSEYLASLKNEAKIDIRQSRTETAEQ